MAGNPDYRDLLQCFNDEKVEYLVVGAYAVTFYSEPRFTKDFDVWVRPSRENALRVFRALERFGAPLSDITPDDLCDPDLVYQIGVPPNRIDIVMGIDGVDFDSAWKNKVASTYDKVPMHILGKKELIRNKRAMNRPQDRIDLQRLMEAQDG